MATDELNEVFLMVTYLPEEEKEIRKRRARSLEHLALSAWKIGGARNATVFERSQNYTILRRGA